MRSNKNAVSAASPADALEWFQRRLSMEIDCWDVHEALSSGTPDFVLFDVRAPSLFDQGHVPGATSFPHRKIVRGTIERWPSDSLFVVYCAGPHCNGADKAAVRLAGLGMRVKVMIGGVTGWLDEGFELEKAQV